MSNNRLAAPPAHRRAWRTLIRLLKHPWVSAAADCAMLVFVFVLVASGVSRKERALMLFWGIPALYRLHMRIGAVLPDGQRYAAIIEQVCVLPCWLRWLPAWSGRVEPPPLTDAAVWRRPAYT